MININALKLILMHCLTSGFYLGRSAVAEPPCHPDFRDDDDPKGEKCVFSNNFKVTQLPCDCRLIKRKSLFLAHSGK